MDLRNADDFRGCERIDRRHRRKRFGQGADSEPLGLNGPGWRCVGEAMCCKPRGFHSRLRCLRDRRLPHDSHLCPTAKAGHGTPGTQYWGTVLRVSAASSHGLGTGGKKTAHLQTTPLALHSRSLRATVEKGAVQECGGRGEPRPGEGGLAQEDEGCKGVFWGETWSKEEAWNFSIFPACMAAL